MRLCNPGKLSLSGELPPPKDIKGIVRPRNGCHLTIVPIVGLRPFCTPPAYLLPCFCYNIHRSQKDDRRLVLALHKHSENSTESALQWGWGGRKINNTKSLCDPFIRPPTPLCHPQYCYIISVCCMGHEDRQAEEICLFIRMRTFTFFYTFVASQIVLLRRDFHHTDRRLNLIKGGGRGIARWHRNRRMMCAGYEI